MRRIMRVFLIVLLLAALCPIHSFAGISASYVFPIVKIEINRAKASFYVGQSITLQTKVSPASRAHEPVVWSSSDSSIAFVNEGVVTASNPGTATITAMVGDCAAACQVTVKQAKPTAIKLSASSVALTPTDTISISVAAFKPSYAQSSITWNSQNSAIASVNPVSGQVTAHAVGSTRIRAMTANGVKAFCTVTVSNEIHAKKLTLSASKKNMSYNEDYQLIPTIIPANTVSADRVITWVSSKPSIATVDDNGIVHAGSRPGKTIITAKTANGRSAKCQITVKYLTVKKLALSTPGNLSSLTVDNDSYTEIGAVISPANATDAVITWTSSNESVATVSSSGIKNESCTIHAVGAGTARITAAVSGKKASFTLRVRSTSIPVTITAAGDVTIGGDMRRNPSDSKSEAYYTRLYDLYGGRFLDNVESLFDRPGEVTLVNLESNFTTSTKYKSKSYVLKADPAYVSVLSSAGVDVVGHSNNHSADYGTVGASNTRTTVKNAGMKYVAGATLDYVDVDGVLVGFCAFNQTGGNVTKSVQKAVKSLKAKGCGVVVVSLHWGKEFVYAASSTQRNLGRAAIDAGADLVVGHHSHVVSGVEKYKDKYIVYGLGTLSSALATPEDMDALIFKQTFKVDKTLNIAEDGGVSLIPVSLSSDDSMPDNVNDAHPYVLSGSDRKRVLDKVKYYSRSFANTLPDSCFN